MLKLEDIRKDAARLAVTVPAMKNRAKLSLLALEKIEALLRSLGEKGKAPYHEYFREDE